MHAFVALQGIEVGKVRQMAQQDDRDIHLSLRGLEVFVAEVDGIFFVDLYVHIGNDPQNRHMTQVFEHTPSLLEQAEVSPELVNDNTLDSGPVFRLLQQDGTIDTGKDASPVDVSHQNHVSTGISCHRHIDQIRIPQVNLRDAAGPFHHDRIIAGSQPVIGGMHGLAQDIPSLTPEIIIRIPVTDGTAVEHDL